MDLKKLWVHGEEGGSGGLDPFSPSGSNPDTTHGTAISWGDFWGSNVGIYGIHGVSGEMAQDHAQHANKVHQSQQD